MLLASNQLDYQRMQSIRDRKKRWIQNVFQLDSQELYICSNSTNKQLYTNVIDASPPKMVSGGRKKSLKVTMKRIEKPHISHLREIIPNTNNTLTFDCLPTNVLRYAALNKKDLQLISKLPSILTRVIQLSHVSQLRQRLAHGFLPDLV